MSELLAVPDTIFFSNVVLPLTSRKEGRAMAAVFNDWGVCMRLNDEQPQTREPKLGPGLPLQFRPVREAEIRISVAQS